MPNWIIHFIFRIQNFSNGRTVFNIWLMLKSCCREIDLNHSDKIISLSELLLAKSHHFVWRQHIPPLFVAWNCLPYKRMRVPWPIPETCRHPLRQMTNHKIKTWLISWKAEKTEFQINILVLNIPNNLEQLRCYSWFDSISTKYSQSLFSHLGSKFMCVI
jgi:hypothetical protein